MIYYLFPFILGACVGSFLNVCIYRLPVNVSIVFPSSHCPQCKEAIRWYDNIPILSYLFLKGRCRKCKARIPFRYFLVEVITAFSFVALFAHFGFGIKFFSMTVFVCGLIVATFVDFEHQIIPDEITVGGTAVGFILAVVFPELLGAGTRLAGALEAFLGILAGGGSIYIVGVLGKMAFKKDAMGGGDVKLMAMVGAFLGWELALLTFFIAPFFGSFVGVVAKIKYKQDIIPYGPYLSLASLACIFWGNQMLNFLFYQYY
jgi:leader peptidase (prepilin peptidase)/N-methyltransferase